uniref:Mutator-like transposase domain-containing protein n=4 Tax=Proconiini TaxID=565685 RepID=A0A1B6JRX1_9HEMI
MKQSTKKQHLRTRVSKRLKASLAINKRWQNVKLIESLQADSNDSVSNTSDNPNSSAKVHVRHAIMDHFEVMPSTSTANVNEPRPLSGSQNDTRPIVLSSELNINANQCPSIGLKPILPRISDLDQRLNVVVDNEEIFTGSEYKLVDMVCVKELVRNLVCPICLHPNSLSITETERNGFACKLNVECENCPDLEIFSYTSKKIDGSKSFDVNRRIVKSFMTIGEGYGSLEKFSLVMNLDSMSSKTYSSHSAEVSKSSVFMGGDNLKKARARVRESYKDMDATITDDTVVDIGVSFDGSWHKRGHTSNYGVGVVIELQTGLVIDYCVLSKYCQVCVNTATELGAESPEFDIWYEGHKEDCYKNYSGSSPAMETKAAEILWKRSLDYKLRYRTIVSDGDAAVFSHLQNLKVYGEDVPIVKEECVNHIAKRLGTGLRNVVKTCKAQGITLGGRRFGSLKQSTIVKLTKYYQNSILRNQDSVENMRQDILATLHHCVSSDSENRHTKCPQGDNSWCFYNRALAKGETPGPHARNLGTAISQLVLKHIFPVYQRLISRELLERCQKGRTQNANESLHSCIWKKCPKTRNVSKRIVDCAVAEAVSEYNYGNTIQSTLMGAAGVSPGRLSMKIIRARDKRRVLQAKKRLSAKYIKHRRQLKVRKLKNEETLKEKEGVTYGAGLF